MNRVALLLFAVPLLALGAAQTQSLGPSDTFAAARLTTEEVRQIVTAIEPSAYDTPESWSAELRAKRVDLGSGAGLVQSCSAGAPAIASCSFCIRERADGYRCLERSQAPIVEAFQFGPRSSHGIKDLTVVANESAMDARSVTYRFDGRLYHATKPSPHGR